MLDLLKQNKTVETRIKRVASKIEDRLSENLTNKGKIDLAKLKKNDPPLFNVLSQYAASKTWRDDPQVSAVDVAKLIEAQSLSTPLSKALQKLSKSK